MEGLFAFVEFLVRRAEAGGKPLQIVKGGVERERIVLVLGLEGDVEEVCEGAVEVG